MSTRAQVSSSASTTHPSLLFPSTIAKSSTEGMANAKGSTSIRNSFQNGKNSLLPPKIPFPSITPSYSDYGSNANSGFVSKYRNGNVHHQRTSSESFVEEQPTWLDDLLDEPETPVRRSHRRSSSDSFAYIDASNKSNIDYMPVSLGENMFRPTVSSPLWGSQNFKLSKEIRQGSPYVDPNYYGKAKNKAWDTKLSPPTQPISKPSSGDNSIPQRPGSPLEADPLPSTAIQKLDHGQSASHDPKSSSEKKDGSNAKNSTENDTKRAKQQFAQRSRVRKLQYIAELERNVQALQAEGSEVTAELEFLNQQNLILSMENKALKQRLESVSQEKLIKYLEHEVLEREIGRLRSLYQQQQPPLPQPQQRQSSSGHRRMNSRDLDSQFANLNLKQDTNCSPDSITGPVHI